MHKAEKVSIIGVFLNLVLFVLKFVIGLLSNSLALMSDAFNSLGDIISYTGIHFAVKIGHKKPDEDHPFGHTRAEPLAGFVVSIFTLLLAVEVFRSAISGFFSPRTYSYEIYAIIVLVFTMIVKSFMAFYYNKVSKEENSPALKAGSVDSRNDILVSGVALAGVIGPWIGFSILDVIAALLISLFIFYSAYKIGRENVDYLMGKSASIENIDEIRKAAKKVKGVKGVHDLKAHYVGNYLHLEIHVSVNEDISTRASHRIGKEVQFVIERLPYVDKAFVHIDPI
jgi:cation diffusion facilitator family transporter